MVKKFITSQATVDDDHELLVKNISKKCSDKKNNLQSYQVYILKNPSTFKNLVQELTGNGNFASTSSSCTSPLVSSPPCVEQEQVQVPIIKSNIVYNNEDYGFEESSPELSFDSSDHHSGLISVPVMSDSSQETIDYMPTTFLSKEYDFQSTWDDMVSFPLQYEEMGSWPFTEMDALVYNNYDSYALQPVMPPDVCVFDYDLSAIM